MTEIGMSWVAGGKLFMACLIGFCYSRSGRGWKLPPLGKVRRAVWLPIMTSITLTVSMFLMGEFTWWLLGAIWASVGVWYAFMKIFAYGEGSWVRKLVGRIPQQFIVGGVHGASCILIAVLVGRWGIFGLAVLVPSLTLGFLGGIFDSDVHAPMKEALCGIAIFLFPLFLV